MSPRERAIFAALTDAIVMPEPPLPPVGRTDAVAGFVRWMDHAPRVNRIGVRAVLLALALGLRGRDRDGRAEMLRRLGRVLPRLVEAMRTFAAAAYYGDAAVMRALGYDAAERVRTGRELRAREGRP